MPIKYTMHYNQGYYVAQYTGVVTDDELVSTWNEFFHSDKWRPGLNKLSDLSEANIESITGDGVNKLAKLVNKVYRERNGGDNKAAIFVPDKLLFGMARMFTAWMGQTPIRIRIFEDKSEAMNWLLNEEQSLVDQTGQ